MSAKRIFFVTGLPRSRTAWLANFLTHGNSFCFHELSRRHGATEGVFKEMDAVDTRAAGTADSGFLNYYQDALRAYPGAVVVIIERDPAEAYASCKRFVAGHENEIVTDFQELHEKMEALKAAVAGRGALRVPYDALRRMETCRTIWTYCTGELFNERRWAELDKLNIQVMPAIAIAEARAILPAANHPAIPAESARLDCEYNAVLADLCKNTPGAFAWLQSLWDVLLTWDHIEDGDPQDRPTANRAFESLMLYWPQNPFFQQNKDRLLPVMYNAISAWRYANDAGAGIKGWDFYTEVPCTVAAIIGGMAAVNQTMPRLRALADQRRAADDKEDT